MDSERSQIGSKARKSLNDAKFESDPDAPELGEDCSTSRFQNTDLLVGWGSTLDRRNPRTCVSAVGSP